MANQRSKSKAFVSGWIARDLKRKALKEAKARGYDGATDLIEVTWSMFLAKPFPKPKQDEFSAVL